MKSICHIVLILLSSSVWAQNGQIKGKISDAENNEPLPFANILLDGTNVGTTSDLDGNFHLQGLSPGYQKLRISFIGYKTQITDDVFVSNTNIPFLEIQLETDESVLQEVVVKADPFRKKEEAPISMQSIGVKELEGNPGSNRDISRVIQSFPGVGSTPAFRNDVIIRGGGPSETRFFLDDVEIPVINHFSTQGASGGPVGIINADFIQNVDFYSSSFPAAKYNALSGILDFKQKEGSKDKTNFQAALGASEASFTVDGPIGRSTSYIFSVRRSYLQFLFAALELPFLPTFNDYQLKVKTNIDSKNQVTLISIGSLDNLTLNTDIDDPDASQEYILSQIPVNNQWSYTIGSVYKHFFDHGYHTVVLSRNMLNNRFYKYPDNDESLDKSLDYLSTEAENKFRYELSARSGDLKINASTNLEYAKYTNRTAQQVFIDDSLNTLNYGTDLQVIKYGLSGQASKRLLNNRLLISLGVRFDGNTYNKSTSGLLNQTSPRFSMSYNIAENTAVKMSMGRYFQQSAYTTLGYRDHLGELVNKNTVKFIGLNQYNAGIEHTFDEGILISVEGFYKDYFQYPVNLTTGASLANSGADYSSVAGAAPVEFTGKGQAIGFEILNRWNYSMFTLLASYTYVRSQFSDINAELVPSSWDSKHLLTLTGSREFKRYWRIGFKWRFVGGLPYTPYDLATSSNIQAWNASGQPLLDYSKLNSERFSAFHQLDLRIDKNYFFTKWAIMLYLDIQNAYNFKNEGQDFITRERNSDRTYKTINNGSQYVLQSSPNKTGTILPTLGIMVKF